MRVLHGLDALASLELAEPESIENRSVVCVGVFDGVHLGHQRLLHELLELAAELRGTPTVITFRNHPDAVLRGEAPPPIVSIPHRLRLLRRAGVQRVLLLTFDDALRNMTPQDFAQHVLVRGLRTAGLLLGYDSAMGKDRAGTPERFRALGAELGFEVREAQSFTLDGQPVSSTRIRDAIARGDLEAAQRLLGRWPAAFGEVVPGDGRGHDLGFATANVLPQSPVLPPNGVYAVEVLHGGDAYPGVANLGVRPTFAARPTTPILEVHLFDFNGNLYGQILEVCFRARLRDERTFPNAAALVAQIRADVAQARALLAARERPNPDNNRAASPS